RLPLSALILAAPVAGLAGAARLCLFPIHALQPWSPDLGDLAGLACFLWITLMVTLFFRALERPLELTDQLLERLDAHVQDRAARTAAKQAQGSSVVPARVPPRPGNEAVPLSEADVEP